MLSQFGFVGINYMKQKLMCYLAEQIRGVSYKPDDLHKQLDENSVILLRANNIDDGQINFDDVVYVDRSKVSCPQFLRKGDILVCASSGSRNLVGKAAQINFEGEYTFGAFCKVVRPKEVDAEYLGMYFLSPTYRSIIASLAQGANINNIKNDHIDNLIVNIGNENECQQIVSILGRLLKAIRLRQQEIKELDNLTKARFVEMFGNENNSKNWNIAHVEEVADVQVGVVIKPSQYYTDESNGIRVFRSLNIGEGFIKDNDWAYFTEEGHQKNSKSILKENDLLIVRSGNPGTACVVTKKYVGYNAIDVIIAHPNCEKVNPYYLCIYTNMPHGKKQIEEGTGGAAQQHFNIGKYNKLKLMMPPKSLQDEFADFVHQVDKSKFMKSF